MKVDLIAHTALALEMVEFDEPDTSRYPEFGGIAAEYRGVSERWMAEGDETGADTLAEFAGRACYQSFHRPNPATRENADYLANILAQGHESVLEHASATFYVTGVSRALTHELIRHRHLSFSELSQRFVNVEDSEIVQPPALQEHYVLGVFLDEHAGDAKAAYKHLVERLEGKGLTRKQAREAARAVMPNATETKIVVTGNMRAWRDVLRRRWSTHADAEIREFAGEILTHLRRIAPATVQDIPSEPFA